MLPTSSSGSTKKAPPVLPVPNSQLVDILKMAEDKMEELQLALDSVRKEKRELQEIVKELKRQVWFKIINNDHLSTLLKLQLISNRTQKLHQSNTCTCTYTCMTVLILHYFSYTFHMSFIHVHVYI